MTAPGKTIPLPHGLAALTFPPRIPHERAIRQTRADLSMRLQVAEITSAEGVSEGEAAVRVLENVRAWDRYIVEFHEETPPRDERERTRLQWARIRLGEGIS